MSRANQAKKHIADAAKSSGVSYQGSEQCIDGYLKSVKLCLQAGESVFLPHIGTINEDLALAPLRTIKNPRKT